MTRFDAAWWAETYPGAVIARDDRPAFVARTVLHDGFVLVTWRLEAATLPDGRRVVTGYESALLDGDGEWVGRVGRYPAANRSVAGLGHERLLDRPRDRWEVVE